MARSDPGRRPARWWLVAGYVACVVGPLLVAYVVLAGLLEGRAEHGVLRSEAARSQQSVETWVRSALGPGDLTLPLGGEHLDEFDRSVRGLLLPVLGATSLRIAGPTGLVVYSTDGVEVATLVELGPREQRVLTGERHWEVSEPAEGDAVGSVTFALPLHLADPAGPVAVAWLERPGDAVPDQLADELADVRRWIGLGLIAVLLVQVPIGLSLVRRLWRQYDDTVHMAHYDPLTGLANRLHFHDRLNEAIAAADRREGNVGLVMIDLDGFKPVNDTGGHAAGDRLLKRVAAKLNEVIRRDEIPARIGGDEFAVVVPNLESPEQLSRMAERLRGDLDLDVDFTDGRTIRVTASLGLAVYPIDAGTPDELVTAADVAMYTAKATRRAGTRRPEPIESELVPERIFP